MKTSSAIMPKNAKVDNPLTMFLTLPREVRQKILLDTFHEAHYLDLLFKSRHYCFLIIAMKEEFKTPNIERKACDLGLALFRI
jgi:hypothetical protein